MRTPATLMTGLGLWVGCLAAPAIAQQSTSISLVGLRIQNNNPQTRSSAPGTISPANNYTVAFSADTRVRGVGGALGSLFPQPVTLDQVVQRFDPAADFAESSELRNCSGVHPTVLAAQTISQSTTITVIIPITVNFSATFRSEIDAINVAGFSIANPVLTSSSPLVQIGYLEFTAGSVVFTRNPTPPCAGFDFNRNGVFPEDQDILDFFAVLSGANCATCECVDFNANGVFPEDNDILDVFTVLAGGTC
jgi:hypothetical protein